MPAYIVWILAACVGGVLLVAAVIFIVVLCMRRRRPTDKRTTVNAPNDEFVHTLCRTDTNTSTSSGRYSWHYFTVEVIKLIFFTYLLKI